MSEPIPAARAEPALAQAEPTPGGLAKRLARVRAFSEQLCAPLATEDYVVQSMPDASPAKWHLAHTTWFFETFVLSPFQPGFRPYRASWARLFNSYYVAAGPRHPRPERGLLTRPTVDEVRAYRAWVDERVQAFLQAPAAQRPEVAALLELGLHHEQQHQELLLTDLHHAFSRNPLEPAYLAARPPASVATPLGWAERPGGMSRLGHEGPGFAFDNEGPAHRVHLEPFELASRPVSAGEFTEFIHDGGYLRPELWLSDGYAAAQAGGWQAPLYWERRDGEWRRFTLHGDLPVDPAAPVTHVSYYEADAFARWAGARLPTEAEWESAARDEPVRGQFVEEGTLGAVGEYNGKFMVNQLVLRGGSCLSSRDHLRASYRNFFPPHARWQVAGLRLAR